MPTEPYDPLQVRFLAPDEAPEPPRALAEVLRGWARVRAEYRRDSQPFTTDRHGRAVKLL